MSKQRFVVCMVAACLAVALASACAARRPKVVDNCRRGISDRDPLIYGGEMRNGFLHLRIAYDRDVEPEHQRAFDGAMALWNVQSKTTGVIFEKAKDEIIDLRLQRGAPIYVKEEDINTDRLAIDEARIERAESTKCAEFVSSGPYIWYSLKMMYWMKRPTNWPAHTVEDLMKDDPQFVGMAKIYAHELGHVLNIKHKPGTSVMHENENKSCEELGMDALAHIQPDDAWDAHRCFWGARNKHREPGATRRPYRPPTR